MNQKEQQRVLVLNGVERREFTGREAAALLGLSLRQARRLLAAYREEGVAALAHGNRGRRPGHAVREEVRKLVLALAQGPYAGCNHHHFTELLEEREGLCLSRSTVRRILVAGGIQSPRRRRPPQHRCRRERYPQEGMLLQIDGSRHDWLEGRGPYLSLVAAIDDATGTVPGALFRQQEDAQGYFLLLQEIIGAKGIPLALYSDRHGIFQVNPKQPESLEEQLAGERQPTQFGRALKELGIQAIVARSPQAKGRIERLWGTFQDRLVAELGLARASTLEEANELLADFLARFNARFAVPPEHPGSAYRPVPQGLDPQGVLCFKYLRRVGGDNTLRFGGRSFQLLPRGDRLSYARARVEVQERLDGSLVVAYQGQVLGTQEAPPHPAILRARKGARASTSPPRSLVGGVSPDGIGAQGSGGAGLGPAHEETHPQAGKTHTSRPNPHHPWRKPLVVTKSLNR